MTSRKIHVSVVVTGAPPSQGTARCDRGGSDDQTSSSSISPIMVCPSYESTLEVAVSVVSRVTARTMHTCHTCTYKWNSTYT